MGYSKNTESREREEKKTEGASVAETNTGVILGVDHRLSAFPFCWRMSGFGAGAEIEPAGNPPPFMLSGQCLVAPPGS